MRFSNQKTDMPSGLQYGKRCIQEDRDNLERWLERWQMKKSLTLRKKSKR